MFVARLTADGRPDATFGNEGSGFAFVDFDSGGELHDIAHDIAIDDGDRIVIAGSVAAPSNSNDFDMKPPGCAGRTTRTRRQRFPRSHIEASRS